MILTYCFIPSYSNSLRGFFSKVIPVLKAKSGLIKDLTPYLIEDKWDFQKIKIK